MQWFKHDSNASQDAKLKRVRMKYGLEGYGLYWYCLELIASEVSQDKLTFELEHDAEVIGFDTGIHVERVNEMMAYMIDLGLFESGNSSITCMKMLKRLDQSMTSNSKMRAAIAKAKENHDSVMISHDSVMQDKNRIDKNRKEDKKDVSPKDDHAQDVLDIYHQVIDELKPNWATAKTFDDPRKRLCRKAYTIAKQRGDDIGMRPLEVLINLLKAMAADPFYSGLPTPQNPNGYRCAIEQTLKADRLRQAIDKLGGE